MSKLVKILVALTLIGGTITASIGSADAHYRRHYRGYYGGWGWGPAWGFTWGFGYPYYARPFAPYYGPYYYAPAPACGYVRVRVWRRGHWVIRRVWRCW
jgi:hypothetical protein